MASLYIHIPFCASRCIYCGFYSTLTPKTRTETIDRYVVAVCKELVEQKNFVFQDNNETLETIYFGGGTPSQLAPQHIEKIFQTIEDNYSDKMEKLADMEISFECNPDDVTEEFAENMRHFPINRISMGAQTFSETRLNFLRRRHKANDVKMAIDRLHRADIHNISIDLMFGFPEETLQEWEDDIEKAIALNVEHLSAYSLMYEEGTPLYRLLEQGKVKDMDEELYRTMYDKLIDRLVAVHYEQYEISNFAKLINNGSSPYRSRHNSAYWANQSYIGVGASAHGYNHQQRRWNVDNLQKYMEGIENGTPIYEAESIDKPTHFNDTVTTALRTRKGIDLKNLEEPFKTHIIKASKLFIERGLLSLGNEHLHLTREGIYVSDAIMSELVWV